MDIRISVPEKLLPIITTTKRHIVLFGGRGSGKTYTAIDYLLMRVMRDGIRVLCAREFMKSLSDSSMSQIVSEIERLDLKGFKVLRNEIFYRGRSAFIFKGLARNPESLKGLNDIGIVFTDEASTVSDTSIRLLIPSIRDTGSQLIWCANPGSPNDAFSERFIIPFLDKLQDGIYEDDQHLVIQMNYTDNPFFPEVLRKEMETDKEVMSNAMWRHTWLGEFLSSVDNSLITSDEFDSCIDLHIRQNWPQDNGLVVAGYDPAGKGKDASAFIVRQGNIIVYAGTFNEGDVEDSVNWAIKLCLEYRIDCLVYDAAGLGAGIKPLLEKALLKRKVNIVPFVGGSSPANEKQICEYTGKTNKDSFFNKRAQYYYYLSRYIKASHRASTKGQYTSPTDMISFCSGLQELSQLNSEVSRLPVVPNNANGTVQMASKADMKKLGIPSPNLADALSMTFHEYIVPPVQDNWDKPINYPAMPCI